MEARMGVGDASDWLSTTPLGVLGVAVPAVMMVAVIVGAALSVAVARRRTGSRAAGAGLEGAMIQAVLGLLALLMAFTFALAVDRFDTRRRLVLDEANAIGTIYLRTQLLGEPHRTRISGLLVDYTDNRVALADATADRVGPLLERNDQLITTLWAATVGAAPSIRDAGLSNAFLTGMNSMIDLDAARKTARSARVPVAVFAVLFVYLIVTAGVLGYVFVGQRGGVVAGFWLILLTLFLLLVFDIDRPKSGLIREEQGPMLQLKASLEAQHPEVFDRYRSPAARAPR
jgi:hypothetical protein